MLSKKSSKSSTIPVCLSESCLSHDVICARRYYLQFYNSEHDPYNLRNTELGFKTNYRQEQNYLGRLFSLELLVFAIIYLHSFFCKNVVFPAQAEYSYFSADFRLKIFLYYS